MKNKIEEILKDNTLFAHQKTDKLLALFEADRKKYALQECKDMLNRIEINFRDFEDNNAEQNQKQFLPQFEFTQENGNGE